MTPPSKTPALMWALAFVATLLTAGVLLGTGGNLAVALAPFAAAAGLYVVLRAPTGLTAIALIALALSGDNPSEGPGMGLFETPFALHGKLLYKTLEKQLHIGGAKIPPIELLCIGLGILMLLRRRIETEPGEVEEPASALTSAVKVAAGALLFWELYGVVRGGSVRFSALQIRTVLFAFTMPWVFAWVFRNRRYPPLVMGTTVAVAFARSIFGIFYWATIIRTGIKGDVDPGGGGYVMTHSDTVLLVTAVITLLMWVLQRPSLFSFLTSSVVLPVLMMAIIVNNRRLAFVSMAVSLGLIYLILQGPARRRVNFLIALAVPLFVVYVGAGWNSSAQWARPIQSLKGVTSSSDSSSATRDIENFNLIVTWKRGPLLGSGFGHEYVEQVKAYKINFEAYLYVPHNSVLWLWSAVGVVGFTCLWSLLLVAVFLSIRTYRLATLDSDKILSLVTVAVVTIYALQSFGDMGLGSWMSALVLSPHLGMIGAAAARTGAWPSAAPKH